VVELFDRRTKKSEDVKSRTSSLHVQGLNIQSRI
jgi:hypothetical protein